LDRRRAYGVAWVLLAGALVPLVATGVALDEEGWLGLIAAGVLLGGAALEGWAGRAYGPGSRLAEIGLVALFSAALAGIWALGWSGAAPASMPYAYPYGYYERPLFEWARARPAIAPSIGILAFGLVVARVVVGSGGLLAWSAVSFCCALGSLGAGRWVSTGSRGVLVFAVLVSALVGGALLVRRILRRDPLPTRLLGTVLAGLVLGYAHVQTWMLLAVQERGSPDGWFLDERISAGWALTYALGPAVLSRLLAPRDAPPG
jgi:hypothetical protein